MKAASPKYVPREWMLVEAYSAAARRDHTAVQRLQQLLAAPYDEQPHFEAQYFRRRPPEAASQGGVAFMS
jgi:uncharacterized protein YdiU (UPF0061 family)